MKPIRTWVLIADCHGARILEKSSKSKDLQEVPNMAFAAPEVPTPGPVENVDFGYVRAIAEALNTSFAEGAFERLVVAGSPRALALLRQLISLDLRRHLSAELPVRVTGMPKRDVQRRLGPVLAA